MSKESSPSKKSTARGKNRLGRDAGASGRHRKNLSLQEINILSPLVEEPTTPTTFDFIEKPQEAPDHNYWAQAPVFVPQVSQSSVDFTHQPPPPILEHIDALEANMRQIFTNLRTYDMTIETTAAIASLKDRAQLQSGRPSPEDRSKLGPSLGGPPATTLFETQQVQRLLESMVQGGTVEVVDARRKNLIRTWIEMGVLELKKTDFVRKRAPESEGGEGGG